MFWRHWRSHTCLSDTLCTWRCLSCWRSGLCCNPNMLLRFGLRSSCLWGIWSKNAAPFHCQTRRPDTAGTIPGWEGPGSTPSGNPHMLSRWAPHSSCPGRTRGIRQVPFCSRTFRADKAGTTLDQPMLYDTLQGTSCIGPPNQAHPRSSPRHKTCTRRQHCPSYHFRDVL